MSLHPSTPILGAHLSIAGGLYRALETARDIDCACVQIFTHSNRQWKCPPLKTAEIDQFTALQKETGVIVFVHASYLLNIASPKHHIWKISCEAIAQELDRCAQLNIPYLIVHPGSALSEDRDAAIKAAARSIDEAYASLASCNVMLLLENMAGQGTAIGSTLAELQAIREATHVHKQVGFCIDTCHAFASGYALNTAHGYATFKHDCATKLGLHRIHAFHMNDSVKDCGSHVDRHADIGKGKIGIEGFTRLMHDADFAQVPKILETPYSSLDDHVRNLNVLRRLAGKRT